MTKRNPSLNHSRQLHVFADDLGESIVDNAKLTPTRGQRKYVYVLQKMCEEHGVPPFEPITGLGGNSTRSAYSDAINEMKHRLKEKGVEFHEIPKDYKPKEDPFDIVWNDPKETMPYEQEASEVLKKALKNQYKIKDIKTCSSMVRVKLHSGGTWFSTARTINGKFVLDKSDECGTVQGWLPLR